MVIDRGLGELSGQWRVGQRVRGRAGLALEDFVERGEDEEGEQCGAGEAADEPTLALTLKLTWPTTSATMQPIIANGMFRMMSTACFTELKELKRSRKIAAMVMGTTMANRFIARCWFSNCPPLFRG